MSDFFSSGSSNSSMDMASKKQAIMDNVRNELALANAQELMNKAGERCFAKCVTKPGASLSGSEQTCLTRCLDRYLEAFNIVSRTYIARITKKDDPETTFLS